MINRSHYSALMLLSSLLYCSCSDDKVELKKEESAIVLPARESVQTVTKSVESATEVDKLVVSVDISHFTKKSREGKEERELSVVKEERELSNGSMAMCYVIKVSRFSERGKRKYSQREKISVTTYVIPMTPSYQDKPVLLGKTKRGQKKVIHADFIEGYVDLIRDFLELSDEDIVVTMIASNRPEADVFTTDYVKLGELEQQKGWLINEGMETSDPKVKNLADKITTLERRIKHNVVNVKKVLTHQSIESGYCIGLAFNGVSFDPPHDDAITAKSTFDVGGHLNWYAGYHYHVAADHAKEIAQDDGHAPMIGYILDGFGLYAYLDEAGNPPENLDECGGHYDAVRGYHYHAGAPGSNQIIKGFRGATVSSED